MGFDNKSNRIKINNGNRIVIRSCKTNSNIITGYIAIENTKKNYPS